MRIVFATYQSIQVIADAQAKYGMPVFDLIVCDEAHRTTGATFSGEDQSNFVKVHDNAVIQGRKRLYMTATPRIYGEGAKSKAREVDAVLASMDDKTLYGELLYHAGFAQAVDNGILADYRVIVLAMDEGHVSASVQKRLADGNSELVLDDATKIVGCWKALSKAGLTPGPADDSEPMRRALAFCRDIESSELVRDEFENVVNEFQAQDQDEEDQEAEALRCEVRHVDGTYNARARGERLDWLKEDAGGNVCRILSNARCLAEGVDVPSLDAILFLHPRNSQIDVVQSVGRVMRRAPGKRTGYVILPIGVPTGVPADQALNDNKKYRVVWQILNALRAHDERLDKIINQGGLGQDVSAKIAIVDGRAGSAELKAITAEVEDLPSRSKPKGSDIGKGGTHPPTDLGPTKQIEIVIDEFSRAIMAKIVEKCGTRDYWEDWAGDVAEIAERHVTRITTLVEQPGSDARGFFEDFLKEVRDDLNESVSERDAIEMLAQHIITRPVFDALFEGHAFVDKNPVSLAMQELLGVIDEARVEREAEKLEGFYASVRRRAAGITEPQARQRLIVELYDKFFRGAFPRTTKMLGIVYTPTEVVDFIIRSVDEVLRSEFGQTLGSTGVHIIDPFTGTGTFVTRLLQSGLIAPDELERKYREEIHANEIVLLAYYIAAINIETAFHALTKRDDYLPFKGICLTDTFAMHESDDQLSFYMKDNSDRRTRQKDTDIRVIIGNPPYSAGQKSENENAQNVAYPKLDEKIRSTYATLSDVSNKQNLYDSYIRAIRWGTDRLGDKGVMAFVSGSAWIERGFADGMRKCLANEFSTVYVVHLRGDIRKSMLSGGRAGEGGNIFGQGSMTGVSIGVFVKNPDAGEQGRIFFHDIGDYLDQKQKLDIVRGFGSISGVTRARAWTRIAPDRHGDWLEQRDDSFRAFLKLGDKKDKKGSTCFESYSLGTATGRDPWCVNPSLLALRSSITATIRFYNEERTRYARAGESGPTPTKVGDFLNLDPKRIKWTSALMEGVAQGEGLDVSEGQFVQCMYRPFSKQWQFYSRRLNTRVYQMPRIFPDGELPNRVIAVTGKGGRAGFSALMLDTLPNLHTIDSAQCFPFWLYEEPEADEDHLFESENTSAELVQRNAITEESLDYFRHAYPDQVITREDVFYYVYGLLHSKDYRERFRNNLSKGIPRIPCVKSIADFRAFREAGRRLGRLHVGYESVTPYPATIDVDGRDLESVTDPVSFFRVIKMKHPGSGKKKDRSTVVYNHNLTVRDIPEAAWNYVVNGKSALSWVMERQSVRTDKASGIVSDANEYAIETIGDPRYPLDLLLRVIAVSLETVQIMNSLPALVIDQPPLN